MNVLYTATQTGDGAIASLSYTTISGTVTIENPQLPGRSSFRCLRVQKFQYRPPEQQQTAASRSPTTAAAAVQQFMEVIIVNTRRIEEQIILLTCRHHRSVRYRHLKIGFRLVSGG
jgi:hypothetical protein